MCLVWPGCVIGTECLLSFSLCFNGSIHLFVFSCYGMIMYTLLRCYTWENKLQEQRRSYIMNSTLACRVRRTNYLNNPELVSLSKMNPSRSPTAEPKPVMLDVIYKFLVTIQRHSATSVFSSIYFLTHLSPPRITYQPTCSNLVYSQISLTNSLQ